jgi:hypothetical protein
LQATRHTVEARPWYWITASVLGVVLLALLAACGGGNTSQTNPTAVGQTVVATVVQGLGPTSVAGATAAATAISGIQTAAPSINATITAVAGTATAIAPTIQAAGGSLGTSAPPASTAIIPTIPQATFVSGIQTAASSTAPTVRIIAPVSGSTIPGDAGVNIVYLVTGASLPTGATTSTPIAGTHVAVVLDDTIKPGQPVPSDAKHVQTMGMTAMLKDVAPGQHTVRVVVVDDKGVPLPNPEAQASVTFMTT